MSVVSILEKYSQVLLLHDQSYDDINGLVQERHNSSVLAMDLHLTWTNPSILFTLQ